MLAVVILPRYTAVLVFALACAFFVRPGHADHPRLLVSADELAGVQARLGEEPFRTMFDLLQQEAERLTERPYSGEIQDLYHYGPRIDAFLYALTGEAFYAERALEGCRKILATPSFQSIRSKGLSRAMAAATMALAYDFSSAAWEARDRELVSRELLQAARGLMRSMGSGANTRIANNWQAVRYGAAGLAALACDETESRDLAESAYRGLLQHLRANLGDNGWNPEGLGYMMYPWQFTGPFGIAAARAGVGDLREEMPQLAWAHWTHYAGTVAIPTTDGHVGIHPDLSDDNARWNAQGTAGLGFWYAPDEWKGAFRWMYDHLAGAHGSRLYDVERGGILYGLLYYPHTHLPQNPAEGIGRIYADRSHGLVMYRNRFEDEMDIVTVVNARARHPRGCHGGADANTFRLTGLGATFATGSGRTGNAGGQTTMLTSSPPRSRGGRGVLHGMSRHDEEGSGVVLIEGSSTGVEAHRRLMAVDYSGRSGAPAVILSIETARNARFWRLNTAGCNTIRHDDNSFTVTAPNGSSLHAVFLAPETPEFRTGTFLRGQGSSRDPGFLYRGEVYRDNRWIETFCRDQVVVVMTLQPAGVAHPQVDGELDPVSLFLAAHDRGALSGTGPVRLHVGAQHYDLHQGGISFQDAADSTVRFDSPLSPLADPGNLLQVALEYNRPDVAATLVRQTGLAAAIREDGWSLLHDAVRFGDAATARLLLEQGMDVQLADVNGWTPLLLAVDGGHRECLDLLLAHEADVDVMLKGSGNTPLHLAAMKGDGTLLHALLDAGADPARKNRSGKTALEMALLRSQHEAARRLSAVSAAQAPLEDSRLLALAAQRGDLDSVRNLLDQGMDPDALNNGWTPLHFAAQEGHEQVVELLLARGADQDARATGRATPLYLAVIRGRPAVVSRLLASGAEVEVVSRSGITPLYAACERGNPAILEALLAAGADVNRPTASGWYPLHRAVQSVDAAGVQVLLDAGAEVQARDARGGWSALHLAAQSGADELVSLLLAAGAPVNMAGLKGETALHLAVRHRRANVAEQLLAFDADPDIPDQQGQTARMLAERSGHDGFLAMLEDLAVMQSER